MLLRCIVFLLSIVCGNVFASSVADVVFTPQATDKVQSLKPYAYYLEDPEGSFAIENVAKGTAGEFRALESYKSAGFTTIVYWLKVTIDLRTFDEPQWFFSKDYIPVGSMKIYSPSDKGSVFLHEIDESKPNVDRQFSTRNFLFKMPTNRASAVTYYIRIEPRKHPANLELTWGSEKAVLEETHDTQMWLGLFYGGCGVMLFYNLFLFYATRDRAYIYYTYFLSCFILVFVNYYGLLTFVFTYSIVFAKCIVLALYGMQHGGILYARSFMDLRTVLPWADRLLRNLTWLLIACAFTSLFLSQQLAFKLALLSIPVILVTALAFSIYRWITGYEPAKIFCLGWLALGFTGIHFTIFNLGLISPSWLSSYGVLIGSLCEIVMSSLALAYRIKILEAEKEAVLTQSNQELESKVLARTKALEESRDLIIKSDSDKRKLIQKVNSAVEDERKAIAVEVHDELNAALITMQFDLKSIISLTNDGSKSEMGTEIRQKAQAAISTAEGLYSRGRNLVRRLRPEVLEILGLQGAIEDMITLYDEAHQNCKFSLEGGGDFSNLNNDISIAAYRIVQESLSNVIKHAKASEVAIRMELDNLTSVLVITISDNGVGFDEQAVTPGIGLIGIQERVHAFSGKLTIHTVVNVGTTITASLPTVAIASH